MSLLLLEKIDVFSLECAFYIHRVLQSYSFYSSPERTKQTFFLRLGILSDMLHAMVLHSERQWKTGSLLPPVGSRLISQSCLLLCGGWAGFPAVLSTLQGLLAPLCLTIQSQFTVEKAQQWLCWQTAAQSWVPEDGQPSVGPGRPSHTTPPSFLTSFLSSCRRHSFSLRFTAFTRFLNPLSFQSHCLASPHLLPPSPPTPPPPSPHCNSPQSLKTASSFLLCSYFPLSLFHSLLFQPTTKTSISHRSCGLSHFKKAESLWFHSQSLSAFLQKLIPHTTKTSIYLFKPISPWPLSKRSLSTSKSHPLSQHCPFCLQIHSSLWVSHLHVTHLTHVIVRN